MRYISNDKTFTRLYGVRTISQKTALNKISWQEVRWFRFSSLGDLISKKMQCQQFLILKQE